MLRNLRDIKLRDETGTFLGLEKANKGPRSLEKDELTCLLPFGYH